MSADILAAAEKREFGGMAAQIVKTKQFNAVLGTNLLPWELEYMPEDWYAGMNMWIEDLPKAQQWRGEVDAAMAKLRSQNQKVH